MLAVSKTKYVQSTTNYTHLRKGDTLSITAILGLFRPLPYYVQTVHNDCTFESIFDNPLLLKDDTLPCKRQALAWQKEPKAWTQALQRYKQFF